MEETNSYIITYLCVIGVAFLASYFLLPRFWLWRWHRWSTRHWSGWLGAGWLLFLVGLAGTLFGPMESPSGYFLFCLLASVVCLAVAFQRFLGQCAALRNADRDLHPSHVPDLRETLRVDPAAKRFILSRYGFTGGLALLFCLSLVVIVTVRTQLAIRSRLQVVALVERGALRPNSLGDIRLPRSLALASINGHVYLGTCAASWDPQSHPHAVQSVIFFPTVSTAYSVNWQDGKADRQEYQMEGYIFAGKSLASDADVEFSNPAIDQLVGPFDTTTKPGWYYGTPWESS